MSRPRRRWLLDLGNSRLKCALADAQGRRGEILALGLESPDLIGKLLSHVGPASGVDEAWLASVAPAASTAAVEDALHGAGFAVHRARTQAACGRLRIAYPEPAHLGVDRFLALLAASERHDGPWLLVSAGSALTVDLLQADGLHLGGLIAPMPDTMRGALAARFAQLDVPAGTASDFAADTADAIASGCEAAVLGLVERSLGRAHERLGRAPTLLLGGGGAGIFAALGHSPTVSTPSLVIDGLAAYMRGQAD